MNLRANHHVDEDGGVHIFVDGMRVWVHFDDGAWIAQGIDVDYATSGETPELAIKTFTLGFCLTLIEHVKRFNTLERFITRRPPDDVYQAWFNAVKNEKMGLRKVNLTVPESEFGDTDVPLLPGFLKVYQPVPEHA